MIDRFAQTLRALIDSAMLEVAAVDCEDLERRILVKMRFLVSSKAVDISERWHVAHQIEALMIQRRAGRRRTRNS